MMISVCVPVYNGAKTIGKLVEEVGKRLEGRDFEIVLVNDGSRDDSEEVCSRIAESNPRVVFVALRRNFGEHNAVMCALNHSSGDCCVIIDDDFQNPPEEILKLTALIEKGYDVAYARYRTKKHNIFRNLGSKFNDLVATALLQKPKDLYLCSFKAISRPLVDEIIKYRGPFPYIDGLLLRSTANIASTYVEHRERAEGESNYTLGKLVSLWLNMFINFSIRPMRIISLAGIATSFFSVVLGVYFLVDKIRNPSTPAGWASLVTLVLFLGGLQTLSLGLIGEYIGKNYLDRNGTPQWTIKFIKKTSAKR